MLFIEKTFPPHSLVEFNNKRRTAISNPVYDEDKDCLSVSADIFLELKKKLETEQKGLCCYCMQRVTATNCRVEHFLPQKMFPEYQTDYYNLYLACHGSYSQIPSLEKHCDVRKGNHLIAKIMSYRIKDRNNVEKKCDDFFKYVLEENEFVSQQNQFKYCWILPNHKDYETLEEFYKNFAKLQPIEKEILVAIEILNLNALELRERRKDLYVKLKKTLDTNNHQQIEKLFVFYQEHNRNFAGMALYFINKKLKELGK